MADLQTQSDNLSDSANSFASNLPGYSQSVYNLSSDQGMQQLDKEQKASSVANQKRGLLYSGLNQPDQGGMATALANRRQSINSGALDTSVQANATGAAQSMDATEIRRNAAWALYGQGLNQASGRLGLMEGVGKFVGQGIGTAAGMAGGSQAGLEPATGGSAPYGTQGSGVDLGAENYSSGGDWWNK